MPDRYFASEPLTPGEFVLRGPEAHHLAVVCRAKPGLGVVLFNGDGAEYPGEVVSADRKAVVVNISAKREISREREHELIVACALPKGDRGDTLVEKLTELGAACLIPLICERGVVVPKAPRLESLRRGVVEASKQCGRNLLMRIEEPQPWPIVAARADLPAERWLLHPGVGELLPPQRGPRVVAIGPEGGFTEREAAMPGWLAVSIGPRILRIETAAIAAAAI